MEQIADGGYIILDSTWLDAGVPNVLLIKTDTNGLIDSKAVSEVPIRNPNIGYCRAFITPKIANLRLKFLDKLKDDL